MSVYTELTSFLKAAQQFIFWIYPNFILVVKIKIIWKFQWTKWWETARKQYKFELISDFSVFKGSNMSMVMVFVLY